VGRPLCHHQPLNQRRTILRLSSSRLARSALNNVRLMCARSAKLTYSISSSVSASWSLWTCKACVGENNEKKAT
jgi:hypothetical protein